MKIISWNVNGIRACAKKGFFEFLQEQDPDILCVQETKAHPGQVSPVFLHPESRVSYWSAATRKGYSGVATFLRSEPQQVDYGIHVKKFDQEGRFVVTRHDDFLLYNVYFPNGSSSQERHDFKMEFLKQFYDHLMNQVAKGQEVIVLGDYNVAHKEEDVYDPEGLASVSGFLPEEREWLTKFLENGFVDSFRQLHPQEKDRFTWWSYKERARPANRGWRIDMICMTTQLAKKLKRAEILDDQFGSDHCPVMVEI